MSDNITAPATGGLFATKEIASVHFPKNLLTDFAGADILGLLAASPDPLSLLGRLKTIADGVTTLAGHVDGLETLATALNGFVDGLEALIGTSNTGLSAIAGSVDTLETLIGATNTALAALATSAKQDTLIGHVDGIEGLIAATNTALTTIDGRVDGLETLITSTNTKLDTLAGYLDGLETLLGTGNTALAAIQAASEDTSDVSVDLTASELHIGQVGGYGFDVVVVPTVTNGAYGAGDIMGGLLTFAVARVADECVLINELQVSFKSAVTPNLRAIIFTADPTSTTKTDNAAYSLNAADAFKARRTIASADFTLSDHGTPNTYTAKNLNIVCKPASASVNLYVLIVDDTGVTLTSTSDMQARLVGTGV